MANELDLSLTPLYRTNGQEQPSLPGLFAPLPPRRAAKGRERDRLISYLTLSGNVPLTIAEYEQFSAQIANAFYQTPGSLTLALKTAAESANATLTERNMHTTGRGQYIMGTLILAALRGTELYIVQSGASHVFWLSASEAHHFHDDQLAGRGLGFSQNARLYFSHAELAAGDRLVFAAQMPAIWEMVLPGERNSVSVEETRRRLMAESEPNLSAVLIHATEGTGLLNILRPMTTESRPPQPATPAPAEPAPVAASPQPAEIAVEPVEDETTVVSLPAEQPAENPASMLAQRFPAVTPPPLAAKPPDSDSAPVLPRHTAASARRVLTPSARRQASQNVFKALAKSVTSLRLFGRKAKSGAQAMATRIMPGEEEEPVAVNPRMMALIAVVVPLVIMVMAVVVYRQLGFTSQYQEYYASAEQFGVQAISETDPVKQRTAWETALYWLDRAEKYYTTDQSKALRKEAQKQLDQIEHIKRLEFQVAIADGLQNRKITQMVSNESELYMLDSISGSVLRAFSVSTGYQLDSGFSAKCKPGNYDGVTVGNFVDIVALDKFNYGATVMGVDASGVALLCSPDGTPSVAPLAQPDTGWGSVGAVAFDANTLYVLDPSKRAVWIYDAFSGSFPDRPRFFFGDQIPQMETAIDLAVSGNDLYLLHSDGHVTTCSYSPISTSPTRCEEYKPFTDTRPGRQSGPTLADAIFSQIQLAPPPDSTLLFLDPITQAVFRFSQRSLELQDQLRVQPGDRNILPAGMTVSAMSLSQSRVLFLCIGGQIYFANNVP